MLILALDTCEAQGSVALLKDDQVLQSATHDTSEDYSQWLLFSIERLLAALSVALRDIDVYAVAAGPGSFTGVRVGLTTAKAWAEVFGRRIAAVSRMEAIAAQASGPESLVAAFADARRGHLFGAMYRRGMSIDPIGEEMVIAPGKFLEWAVDQAGTEAIQWISTEPRQLTETEAWAARRNTGERVQTASALLAPLIGRIGYRRALENRLVDALSLDANYVRRSDAQTSWTDNAQRAVGEAGKRLGRCE